MRESLYATAGADPTQEDCFHRLERNLFERLEQGLSPNLVYHDLAHIRYVLEKTAFLAEREDFPKGERHLLLLAALYHDSGFLVGPADHELRSCEIARRDLRREGFSAQDIEKVCDAIMATKIPQQPDSDAGKILADADLFYMGTAEYDLYAEKLYREISFSRPDFSRTEWLEMQISFLQKHRYHTDYGQKVLEPVKQKHLERLLRAREHGKR